MMPGSGEDAVRTTGGQVDSIVLALIDALYDKDENVCQTICNSLYILGKQQPNLVLSSCLSYLLRHPKLPLAHRILILHVMDRVCQDTLDKINKGLVLDLIKQSIEEIVSIKEIVHEWQGAASGIIVSLGQQYHNEVMEFLLMKFQLGSTLPHFYIIQTLADLSTANVFGMVPYLKGIIGVMLPMMGMIKLENTKRIFAYALSHFSEAILEYLANIEKAPDPTVKKSAFSSEISSAYDVLFNTWIQSKDAKVRAEVVKALGQMTHLLERDKLEEQLSRVIPGILSLYKRQQESYHTTQGLCMILDAAIQNESNSLELQLETILNSLFPQACILPDYSQPNGVKNHNEVLRCFTVLTSSYSGRLINFLMQKLENYNEKVRIGTLAVLKHLINSCDSQLYDKMTTIITGLKLIISDQSNKVKKVMAQVIMAMAHRGYLEMEGGKYMVLFIVRQCALPEEPAGRRPADLDYVSNEALRAMCENVIHLLTTTVEKMENVLWPDMLECLLQEEFTAAVAPVSKSLSYLVGKKRELGSDFDIDYSNKVNIPKPYVLLARMIVLLGLPFSGRNRGLPLLRLMKAIVPLIDKSLIALWDSQIPVMIKILEETKDSWNQQMWEEQLINFLLKSIEEVDREDWTTKLGKSLLSQFSLYPNQPDDKIILIKILGAVMKKISNRQFINNALDGIFEAVQHSNPKERTGCAIAVGYCAATHLDVVLVKLEQVAKGELRKSSGLLGFIKDIKGDSEQEKIKATVILSYGYVALNASSTILTTRIETPILRSVAQFYQSSKDLCVKQSMLQTVKLIAEAIHPNHLKEFFTFRSRDEVLALMKSILKNEVALPLTTTIRAQALGAAASLVSLEPPLSEQDKSSLIQTALNAVYPLPREHKPLKNHEESLEDIIEYDHMFNNAFENLNQLLKQLLLKEKTPENLQIIMKLLNPWMISKHDFERERCMQSIFLILKSYHEEKEELTYKPFSTLGICLGLLIPRCTDPQVIIRLLALDCISALLQISNGRYNDMGDGNNDLSLDFLKDQVVNDAPTSLFSLTNELAKVVSCRLPSDQVCSFIYIILDGLCDPHSNSSSGASVVLNGVMKLRGREIRPEIPHILECLQVKLGMITCPQTRTGALRSIRILASHHLSAIIGAFLNYPFPFDDRVVDSWRILAQDKELGKNVLDYLLEILSDSTLFEMQPNPQNHKMMIQVAMQQPLVAVCALKEIFRVSEIENCVKDHFDKIFSLLLLAIGSYIGTYPPALTSTDGRKDSTFGFGKFFSDNKGVKLSPIRYVTETFKAFLLCAKQENIVSYLTDGGYWVVMQDENKYPEAIAVLADALCTYSPSHIPKIVANLNSALNSICETQRIVTVALFAELLSKEYHEKNTLTEPLMNNLLGRLVDTSHIVRRLCIRGLGCVSRLEKDQVQRYSTTVLSAMMAGMDDKDDPDSDITLEAMSGLSSVLAQVAEQDVRGILVNIALRIRPMFDKEKAPIRAAAFSLFGNLSRFGDGPSKEPFVEQIHNNFVTLLLHLNDEDHNVIKSCKQSLRLLGPMLSSDGVNTMFQKYLRDECHLHYGEFVNDLTKAVTADFPEKISFYITACLSYLKSSSPIIQGNAAILLGFFLGNLPVNQHATISKERICGALIFLLKDSSSEVRIKAAEALSLLSSY